jgi:LmbE family N-acetylglucosaminyl deacetylase
MRVLAVGAHPDDIELRCGATFLAHQARGDEVTLLVMTTGERGRQDARSRIGEQEDAAAILGASLTRGGFEDGNVPEGRDAIAATAAAVLRPRLITSSRVNWWLALTVLPAKWLSQHGSNASRGM